MDSHRLYRSVWILVVLLMAGLVSVFCLRSSDSCGAVCGLATTARGTALCGIDLGHKPSAADYMRLKEAGVRVVAHHYGEGLLVEADPPTLERLSRGEADFRVWPMGAEKKIQKSVDLASSEPQAITVAPLEAADFPVLERTVQELGGRVLARMGVKDGVPRLQVRLPGTSIVRLAETAEVSWIENRTRPRILNDVAVGTALMNVEQVRTEHGLTGRGQVITTSDSGVDGGLVKQPMHADLRDNLIGFACSESSEARGEGREIAPLDVIGHGTHTAGSLVGTGACSGGRIRGVAHEAKLWAWFCSDGRYLYPPDDYEDTFRPTALGTTNAYIHSASWGGSCNVYDKESQAIDTWCWSHPDFLPVFAAGNAGSDCSVSAEAGAKNVLAVGSTESVRTIGAADSDDPDALARHSSRGPMPDGRIKPDICAPGTYILSTRSSVTTYPPSHVYDDYYFYESGTSMSTPLVAGTATLIRQWLVEQAGFTNRAPSSALLKAIITGGATRLGNGVPNRDFGWGRVNLTDTLFPANGSSVALRDHIAFGEGSCESFTVTTTNAAPLDVQLCWVDYPAAPQTSDERTLIVDLDLVVSNLQTGATYTPDDHLNNLESVHLDLAEPGTYRITVCGHSTAGHSSEEGGAAAVYLRGAFGGPSADEPTGTVTAGATFPYAPQPGGPEYDVPHDWFVRAGLAAYGDSVEGLKDRLGMAYAPGYTGWEAFVAGLTATNETFRAEITQGSNGVVYVSWRPNLNTGSVTRIYRVLGRTELGTGEWEPISRPSHRFFKVDVSMPTGAAGEETAVPGSARGNVSGGLW